MQRSQIALHSRIYLTSRVSGSGVGLKGSWVGVSNGSLVSGSGVGVNGSGVGVDWAWVCFMIEMYDDV